MTQAFLALGSNLGDRAANLQGAVDGLARAPGTRVIAISRVYETAPVGGPEQGPYLNAVVEVATDLDPHALLAVGQQLERAAQRVRGERWGPRTLDVDVLLFDDIEVDTDDLVVPHPRMWERAFVLVPLRDVAPDLVRDPIHPGEGVSLAAVALTLPWMNDSAPSP
ncbi:MAG TPA: 2-amino-4-hydroxy-6-hydroxymethyldihydropteridine diphosphokinase [Acidimicrobiia bacterium]|nr:2-amino-4-hydroxy-6-hydroxymethyldihydropteridine diphosphokinase [Acidimicrobiia bacterium]